MPIEAPPVGLGAPEIPLARWADRQLRTLVELSGAKAIAGLSGAAILGERAALNGFVIPGRISAGGGCRLLAASDGWIALNLARPDDRALLPALFGDASLDPASDNAIAARIAGEACAAFVARGRELGLAIAATGETLAAKPVTTMAHGPPREAPRPARPLVVDLSSLWAGPLAAHTLWLGGAEVVKVESTRRPDAMREGDPGLFALLNQGKASVSLDFTDNQDRAALLALLARADCVIEAARPRALRQLGIDGDAMVAATPGLCWISITGHGASGEEADWVGFGDDCAVAAGLTGALIEATGKAGFVGDAIADPLTGLTAACQALEVWNVGAACRIGLSMTAITAAALIEEQLEDPERTTQNLREWSAAEGQPFPAIPARSITAAVRPLGADNHQWLGRGVPC